MEALQGLRMPWISSSLVKYARLLLYEMFEADTKHSVIDLVRQRYYHHLAVPHRCTKIANALSMTWRIAGE